MQAVVELPRAFSVRDDRELQLVQDLMARMNRMLLVTQVATGLHVNGGRTVNWVVVYLDGEPLTEKEVRAALGKLGWISDTMRKSSRRVLGSTITRM